MPDDSEAKAAPAVEIFGEQHASAVPRGMGNFPATGATFIMFKRDVIGGKNLAARQTVPLPKVLMCRIPKNGCSEFDGLGYRVLNAGPAIRQRTSGADVRKKEPLTVTVVLRSPFARFNSWYRDKILDYQFVDGRKEHRDSKRITRPHNIMLLGNDTTVAFSRETYALALGAMGEQQLQSLDPHLRSQTRLCELARYGGWYDVFGTLEDSPAYARALSARVAARAAAVGVRVPRGARTGGMLDTDPNAPLWIRHRKINGGGASFNKELSCVVIRALARAYADDLEVLPRLTAGAVNYSAPLIRCGL